MAYEAKVLKDSATERGERLTTLEVVFPRFVLAEFNTHRMLSRNSASSRAIPVEKQLTKILDDPFIPAYWGANRPGMQASEELSEEERQVAEALWLRQRDYAVLGASALIGGAETLKDDTLKDRIHTLDEQYAYDLAQRALATPLHKQLANRVLEPYMWHTAIVSATDWENFFALRAHPDAQPEIRITAENMRDAIDDSQPQAVNEGEFHLPLIQEDELDMPLAELVKISVGRCARVSYLTHEGVRDPQKDIQLYERLATSGHMSPMEHVATPMSAEEYVTNPYSGNFHGWLQHRKTILHEDNFARVIEETR
jgi:thymidylate synthase ThyX